MTRTAMNAAEYVCRNMQGFVSCLEQAGFTLIYTNSNLESQKTYLFAFPCSEESLRLAGDSILSFHLAEKEEPLPSARPTLLMLSQEGVLNWSGSVYAINIPIPC